MGCDLMKSGKVNTAQKVTVFGVILVRIVPHSTLFRQWNLKKPGIDSNWSGLHSPSTYIKHDYMEIFGKEAKMWVANKNTDFKIHNFVIENIIGYKSV